MVANELAEGGSATLCDGFMNETRAYARKQKGKKGANWPGYKPNRISLLFQKYAWTYESTCYRIVGISKRKVGYRWSRRKIIPYMDLLSITMNVLTRRYVQRVRKLIGSFSPDLLINPLQLPGPNTIATHLSDRHQWSYLAVERSDYPNQRPLIYWTNQAWMEGKKAG